MADPAPGYARRPEEPHCYNCGGSGHWAIGCPEPTRQTPAGLEAWRSSSHGGYRGGKDHSRGGGRRSNGPIITRYGHPAASETANLTPQGYHAPPGQYQPPHPAAAAYPVQPPAHHIPHYPPAPSYPPPGPYPLGYAQPPPPPPGYGLPPAPLPQGPPPMGHPHRPPSGPPSGPPPPMAPPDFGGRFHPQGQPASYPGAYPQYPPAPIPALPQTPHSYPPQPPVQLHAPKMTPHNQRPRQQHQYGGGQNNRKHKRTPSQPKNPPSKQVQAPLASAEGIIHALPPKPPPTNHDGTDVRREQQKGKNKNERHRGHRDNRDNRESRDNRDNRQQGGGPNNQRRSSNKKGKQQNKNRGRKQSNDVLAAGKSQAVPEQASISKPESVSGSKVNQETKEEQEQPNQDQLPIKDVEGKHSGQDDQADQASHDHDSPDSQWQSEAKHDDLLHVPDEVAEPPKDTDAEEIPQPPKPDSPNAEPEIISPVNREDHVEPLYETEDQEYTDFDSASGRDVRLPSVDSIPNTEKREDQNTIEEKGKKKEIQTSEEHLRKRRHSDVESTSTGRPTKRPRSAGRSPPLETSTASGIQEAFPTRVELLTAKDEESKLELSADGDQHSSTSTKGLQMKDAGHSDESRSSSRRSSVSSRSSGLDSLEAELLGLPSKNESQIEPSREPKSSNNRSRGRKRRPKIDSAYSRRW